ncbi:Cu and Ag efflux protein CusF [Palleronia salina]|uniref:Cu and Ag efflux protein CusF n=1 Tax=Palleronia salina TaxID=313368 RepID=A0A1M6BCQ1_9RHOB|nr:copper-binding protein [Palleronia salina]SHI46520.1 Cu and Ag efflux protein CusF [Palleronia salina]
MKHFVFAAALALAAAPALADGHFADGTITKIDPQWNKLTIDHGPLANLDMPAMRMVFEVSESVAIDDLAEGDRISFAADRVNGKLTVVEMAR